MADVTVRKSIYIVADTIGDVMKWLNYVDSNPMSTQLTEPVTLEIQVDERTTSPIAREEDRREDRREDHAGDRREEPGRRV